MRKEEVAESTRTKGSSAPEQGRLHQPGNPPRFVSFSSLCMLIESRADLPEDGYVYKYDGYVVENMPTAVKDVKPERLDELIAARALYVLWGQKSRQFDELDGDWDGIRMKAPAVIVSGAAGEGAAEESIIQSGASPAGSELDDGSPRPAAGQPRDDEGGGLVVRNNYKGFVFELRGANVDELYEAARLKWELTDHPIHKPGYAAAMAMLDQAPGRTKTPPDGGPRPLPGISKAPEAKQGTLL